MDRMQSQCAGIVGGLTMIACVVIAMLAGCFDARTVTCGDTVCPPGNLCGGAGVGGCVDPTLCSSAGDGTACGAAGACLGGECVPAACGNGHLERDESCDDGNLINHDGCSSTCVVEAATWTQSMGNQPPRRYGHSIAYSPSRGRVLMFGGYFGGINTPATNETWEWDGVNWAKLSPPMSPTPRMRHAMVLDPTRDRTLVFGGLDASPSVAYRDTWSWDGTTWAQVATTGPSYRTGNAMVFDPSLQRPMLFGGDNGTGPPVGDMWTWNGSAWQQATPSPLPAARGGASLASDRATHRVLLFSGFGTIFYDDTWLWNGTAWQQLTTATAPSTRGGAGFAADDTSGLAVLYGGGDSGGGPLFDTWMFKGSDWSVLSPGNSPMLVDFAFTYDPHAQGFVATGTTYPDYYYQTWLFQLAYPGEREETCIAGQDGDGDGLVGCADPDCWALCTPLCPPGATNCDPAAPHCGDGVCNPALETQVCPEDCP
jgi:cysteine-rich repeat protein